MPNHPSTLDPVELLLRRISQRALAGSLFAGAAAASGCAADAQPPGLEVADVGSPVHGSESEPAYALSDPLVPSSRPGARPARPVPTSRDAGVDAGRADADAGVIDVRGFAGLTCEPGRSDPLRAGGLTLREPVDYVAIRERYARGFDGADAGTDQWADGLGVRTLSEAGEPCKTATTPACAEKVRGHPVQFVTSRCLDTCYEQSIVTTRGNEVRRYPGKDAVAQLGEIDTTDDALLAVHFAGYNLRCNEPQAGGVRPVDGGFEVLATRITNGCTPVITSLFRLFVARDGSIKELQQTEFERLEGACTGRMAAHVDLQADEATDSPLGDYLAHAAQLEAASVHAFAQLARELEAHGAPADLVARAWSACDDEIRHADEVGALAVSRGGLPGEPTVHAQAVRRLEEIATENAVEGCVRETYGALVGAYQAAKATDLGVRRAMVRIAEDEARHAALSHAVHAWIVDKLDAEARARVHAAERQAIGALRAAASEEPDAMLRELAGLPDAATARALIDQLARELWLPSLNAA